MRQRENDTVLSREGRGLLWETWNSSTSSSRWAHFQPQNQVSTWLETWQEQRKLPTFCSSAAVAPRVPRRIMPMAVEMPTGEKKTLPSFVLSSSLKRSNPNCVVAASSESMMVSKLSRRAIAISTASGLGCFMLWSHLPSSTQNTEIQSCYPIPTSAPITEDINQLDSKLHSVVFSSHFPRR